MLFPITFFGQSVTNSPTAAITDGGAGTPWNTGQTVYSQNDLATLTPNIATAGATERLLVTGFNFAIPNGATIVGITVSMDKYSTSATSFKDNIIQLTKDGTTVVGSNKADLVANWPGADTDTYTTYGGVADLWGTTFTEAEIEAASFGVIIKATNPGTNNRSARIDHVQITITYTLPPANVITLGAVTLVQNDCNWKTLSDIVITEGAVTNFAASQTNQTYVLTFNNIANFDFNAGVGSVSVSAGDITASSISVTNNVVTLTLSTDALANQTDVITISGLQVKTTNNVAGTIIESGSTGTWSQVASSIHANITANSAPTIAGGNGAFIYADPSWVTVSNIVINENVATNFAPSQSNKTYVISAPTNFAFNTGVLPTITVSGGTSVTINSYSFVGADLVLDLTTDASLVSVDAITISGLQVQQVSALATGYIQFNCASSTGSWSMKDGGDVTTNHGTLTITGPVISNGTGGGNWNVGSSWLLGVVPTATDIVIIQAGDNIRVTNSPTVAEVISNGTISIISNVTLTTTIMTMNSPSLLQGDNNNSLVHVLTDFTIFDGSTVDGNGGTLQLNIDGNLLCSAGVGVATFGECNMTIAGLTTVDGEFTFGTSANGRKNFVGGLVISATGVMDNTIGEDPRIDGDLTNLGSWIGCTGGTCTWTFGRNSAKTYTISGNPVEFSVLEARDAGDIIVNNGIIVISRNNNGTLTGNGTFTNNGSLYMNSIDPTPIDITTFNASNAGNYIYFNGAGDQGVVVPSDGCYNNLIISTSGIKTPAGNFGIKNALSIIDNAIFNIGTRTINDGCGGTAALNMSGNSQFIIGKCSPTTVPELTGTYSLSGGTIVLDGACAQVLKPGVAYNNLTLNGSGAVTMAGITTINGDLTIAGSATMTNNATFTLDCSKTFTYNSTGNTTLANNINIGNFAHTNTGDLIDGGRTITVCGSTWSRSVAVVNDFVPTGTVVFNPSSGTTTMTSTAAGNLTRFHNVTINANKTLVCDVNGIQIGNTGGATFTNNGIFTHNSSTVTVIGNCTIAGNQPTTFNNLTINNTFTLTGHDATADMNIEGNWTNNNAVGGFTHNSGRVSFIGGNAQTMTKGGTETFFDVYINKTVGTMLTTNMTTNTINNSLVIDEGIFNTTTRILNGTGSVTMNSGDLQMAKTPTAAAIPEMSGAYAMNGGTVTLNGAGTQTLRPNVTYYNLLFTTSGVKTIANIFTINGNITVSGTATLTLNSSFVQAPDKTFFYISAATTTLTAATPITIGSFSQTLNNAASILNINGNTVTINGTNWNKTGASVFTATGTSRLIFNGSNIQTITHSATNIANITINNPNNVVLNSWIYLNVNLTLNSGNIITGANIFYLSTAAATVTHNSGHVEGNLRKYFDTTVGSRTKTFEVGNGSDYTPITISFASVTTAGVVTCKSTNGDHWDIFSSDINPSKSVNKYWTISNSTVFTTFNLTLSYPGSAVDGSASTSDFSIFKRAAGIWADLNTGANIVTGPTSTQATLIGSTVFGDFAVGEKIDPSNVLNAVAGAMNWNNQDNWIRIRSGVITINNSSINVVGNPQTKFLSEICTGDILLLESSPTTVIGTVASVIDDHNLTLTSNATSTANNIAFGMKCIPGNIPTCALASPGTSPYTDFVIIGNPSVGAAVQVTIDNIPNNIYKLRFNDEPYVTSLDNATYQLNISSNVQVRQPTVNGTNVWNINNGIANISGSLKIASDVADAAKIAKVSVSNGKLISNSEIIFDCNGFAATGVLDLSTGTSTVEYLGAGIILNKNLGTITPGVNSVFNYISATKQQTINLTSEIKYNTLWLNNTFNDGIFDTNVDDGVILSAALSTLNVTGNLVVQTGIFDNNGFAIVGNGAKLLNVGDNANLFLRNSSAFPTGFGTNTLTTLSNVYYLQTTNHNVSSQSYGNLYLTPYTDAVVSTFTVGTTTTKGNLVLGNGINVTTASTSVAAASIDVDGDIIINTNQTFNLTNSTANPVVNCGGNWTNNGGTFIPSTKTVNFDGIGTFDINGTAVSQTFYNIVLSKTGTLGVGGSTTTLNTNNITLNTGSFIAPATLNLDQSTTATITLNSGTNFDAGTLITIRGNWTNNGGVFNPNTGLVQFVQGSAQIINGTAASHTFNNFEINKTAGSVTIGGSATTVTTNDFTQTNFGLNAAAVSVLNVNGNFTISTSTFTPPALGATPTMNIKGNILNNGGTLTWSTNVTLNGTTQQTIGGTLTIPTFTNLTINNTDNSTGSAVVLNKPIRVGTFAVAGVLTLTDGHIKTTATNVLTLSDISTVVLNAPVTQDSSFVRGPMAYEEDDSGVFGLKIFPVGNQQLLHKMELNIRQSAAGTNTYTSEYFIASDAAFGTTSAWTLAATIDKVSAVGHWDLSKSGATTISSASVTLHYLASDQVTDGNMLSVAKGNPSTWTDLDGTGIGVPSGSITSATNFITFSRFALANKKTGSNPLPVELLDFTADLNDDVVDLKWSTASELNNDYFVVERSENSIDFEEVKTVDGNGNSSELINYFTTDENPLNGISYYRLKQVDFDGKTNYSKIISIDYQKESKVDVRLYPNPVENGKEIFFELNGLQKEKEILVVVLDINGKELYSKISIVGGCCEAAVIAIDAQDKLLPGVYFVIGSSDDAIYSKKLVIK